MRIADEFRVFRQYNMDAAALVCRQVNFHETLFAFAICRFAIAGFNSSSFAGPGAGTERALPGRDSTPGASPKPAPAPGERVYDNENLPGKAVINTVGSADAAKPADQSPANGQASSDDANKDKNTTLSAED